MCAPELGVRQKRNSETPFLHLFPGKILVSHALGYISASKSGLKEPELEDLLSLDDIVLNDVYQFWTPPIRKMLPSLWFRIHADIGELSNSEGS